MHFLQLARRGLNVVLISRDLSKLKHEAKEIGEYRKGGGLGNAALQAQGLRFDGAWSGRGRGVVGAWSGRGRGGCTEQAPAASGASEGPGKGLGLS